MTESIVGHNIVELTADNFQSVIVEQSQQKLVIVGFWTARDQGCIDLMDTISAVSTNYPEDLIFAKIDVDSQSQIAMQFGIQSVPTVALIKEARPLDNFVGSKTREEIEAFLQPHLPQEQDVFLAKSRELIADQDYSAAFSWAKKAFDLAPQRADIKMVYADVNLNSGKLDVAEEILSSIKIIDQDSYYHSLIAALELAKNAADSPEIKNLQKQLQQDPQNKDVKVQLAVQLNQAARNEEALDLLYSVLMDELAFGDAKKLYLDILTTLPDGDPLITKYRRKIYSLLY